MFEPIAIVGRSCILPGADSPAALWEAVLAGRDLISSVPADRWGMSAERVLTPDPEHSADRAWSDRGGYVRGFDAMFREAVAADPFYRDAEDLLALDPLFHWVLHTGRQALRQAGHDGRASDRVSAVLGNLSFPSSGMSRYAEHVWLGREAVDPRNRFMSGLPALLLADELGLGAGAFALDAACASSLYAMKLACDQLHDRRVDLTLAGAVCHSDDLFIHVGFCALDAMSRTGQSRPFHAGADGLVPAEGCAVVALKRLDDAVTAGDRIYGVIRGIGLSNDGRGRGLLAPDTPGQSRALRRAWDDAGLDVQRLSMVECHATGTPVGDATEIATLHEVFGDREGLPLGSLKSNLGHLITAAGGAAVLKVLGAFEAGIRPPTLHVDSPNPALADTPYRLLTEAEPWSSDGPRVAAIDAFGFGGNNAHLILEEYDGSRAPAAATPRPPSSVDEPVVVVGVGVRAPGIDDTADLYTVLDDGRARIEAGVPARGRAHDVVLPLQGLKFPPRDLDQTLAQQLMVLAAALEATAGLALPAERTGVLLGSQSDPEVCRYGARWRLAEWYADRDPAWLAAARDAVVPVLRSAGVVGNMPNIPANRIGSQFDLGGPGFTVAAEEHSGIRALQIAHRMLRTGEIDVALAGAVDLSAEPVHEAATAAVLGPATAGDAAVVLVLKRQSDAQRDGDRIWAAVELDGEGGLRFGGDGLDLSGSLGRAHAAQSMLHVAAAVVACATGQRPEQGGHATAWSGDRHAEIVCDGMLGSHTRIAIRAVGAPQPAPTHPAPPARPLTFPAHPPEIVMPPHPSDPAAIERMAPAPALPSAMVDPPSTVTGTTGFEADPVGMRAAPQLPRITPGPAPSVTAPPPQSVPASRVAPAPAAHTLQAVGSPPPPSVRRPPPPPPPSVPFTPAVPFTSTAPVPPAVPFTLTASEAPAFLAPVAALTRQLTEAHRDYLERQREVHARFLQVRERTHAAMLLALQQRGGGAATELPAPVPVPPSSGPTPSTPIPTPPPAPRAIPVAPPTAKPAAATPRKQGPPKAADLPGPKYSREQLEILASAEISRVFGPQFALQDAYPRQVRMPTPPLLLADRVTGLDAEPGSMTTGVIWTETDITADAWYLHDGTMPAGAMIEAGQADLLLISYLGADFRNRGERVYRLLGCQLVYSGGLPRPGETLHYEIHVDGHANLGQTAIFFFHYDCLDDTGQSRLIVREGQAGFFTDEELAESGGILWTAETGEHDASARVDPPRIGSVRSSFTEAEVLAFAEGDGHACFGPGYERLQSHVRPPRMATPPMSFWQRVTDLDPRGGPWGRGYLRAEQDITPDDWFFQGHFKDDPCMPGTMMFEACLQAVGFAMAAYGFTLSHDGWTFEPVPDLPYDLRCRGQVTPSSERLIYEVFVEEVHDGPWPTIYADFLCTVDGLKAFHARRVGVRLRPDWPLSTRPELLATHEEPEPVAIVDGFPFGYASLLACAWGKPSAAFGPMYQRFDDGMPCPRLPGPPYHFMTRVTHIDGAIGGMQVGTAIELSYDIPPDAWYFDENGHRTMPFCVLLEAALQPCGWIASYVGSVMKSEQPLLFRNLDGTATWKAECLPDSGTLRTRAKITSISQSAGMIIESFEVTCLLGDTPVYEMSTVFGFFPVSAFESQTGIVPTEAERAALEAPSDFLVDLTPRPARYCTGTLRLAEPMLLMLDRVTGYWPDGGEAGLGRLRSEKDVDPGEWFFKAHFFGDPVQPGSLGLEALLQLLQFFMIERDLGQGMAAPRFEPLMIDRAQTWKYRGQVVPHNDLIRGEIEITKIGEDDRGRYAIANGYLWVDALRIYQWTGFGMRIVDHGPSGSQTDTDPGEEILDPARDPWLADHRPTWTVPALPAMSMVDRLVAAAQDHGQGTAVEVRDVQILGWVKIEGPVRLRTVVTAAGEGVLDVALEVWRERPDARLSRFEPAARGTVVLAAAYPVPPDAWPVPDPVEPQDDPYASGALFHGPSFQYLTSLALGPTGGVARLDVDAGRVPRGALHQGLLDAVLHVIPHDDLHRWDASISQDQAAYPLQVSSLRIVGPPPTQGEVRVIARYAGRVEGAQGVARPRIQLQAFDVGQQRVWVELDLVEVLLPKGPIGRAAGPDRVAFLRDRRPVPGLGLSTHAGPITEVTHADIRASDWLEGTVAAVYGVRDGDLASRVAVADRVALQAGVHPGTVAFHGGSAVSAAQPLTRWPVDVRSTDEGAQARITGEPELDLAPVVDHWSQWFQRGRWPVEDVYYGLIRRFLRRVHVEDPGAHAAVRGRSVLYLANHQVGVESLWFSIVASGLNGVNTVTLAKAEHRTTWLGRLIAHCFSYPGVADPQVITFFDRDDKGSLPRIIGELAAEMAGPGKSAMVHVEGTRSLDGRTPVQKMSGAFLDLALKVGAPVVPVRFVGGLPPDPLPARLEFPVQMGRQDVWLGRPILPEALQAMTYKDRKDHVIDALNGLGPPQQDEVPFSGDPALQAEVDAWVAQTGAEAPHAVLLKVLQHADDVTEPIARLAAGVAGAGLKLTDSPEDRWLGELARRVYGPRGPQVG